MANSLRAKINKLKHDGCITDAECQELLNKLDGHDKAIINATIDEFVSRLEKHEQENWVDHQEYGITWSDIELIAEQMKGSCDE